MKYSSIRSKPVTIAIVVIPGEEPNAMGIGPIIISPPKAAFLEDNSIPASTKAEPSSIKMIPSLIRCINRRSSIGVCEAYPII